MGKFSSKILVRFNGRFTSFTGLAFAKATAGTRFFNPHFVRKKSVVRAEGIEPSSVAWKAAILAIIRRPQDFTGDIITDFLKNTTINLSMAQKNPGCKLVLLIWGETILLQTQ